MLARISYQTKHLICTVLGGLAVIASMTACAADSQPEASMEALEKRVTARWQTMIAKDFEATWDYTTPNYRRVFPKSLYVNNFSYSVDWELTGMEVVNYDASAAVASVAVRVMSKPAKQTWTATKFGATPITINERWLYIDGEWWFGAND